jgi:hypothetical protein
MECGQIYIYIVKEGANKIKCIACDISMNTEGGDLNANFRVSNNN